MTVSPSGSTAAILPWAPLTAALRSLLHTAASRMKSAQQCTGQRSMRDFNGTLPGSTADHRHFASEKIWPPPGIIWGTNTQPPGSSCGVEDIHFYLRSGEHSASREYTKTIAASDVSKKKDKDEGEPQRLSNDVEEASRKYTAWNKLSPSSKLLQESKSSTSSVFLTNAFPHLLGEFRFWLNTWEVGEISLLFKKALQTLP